ncbi:DUF6233 domain-containing protein [Streptomyces sp. R28]|uniref:DUF6233 domain-containing protein n=1 Tax=Streptomyces sp. R28 TaxID=3238628 RepID=A0AB39QBC6_9ACTN
MAGAPRDGAPLPCPLSLKSNWSQRHGLLIACPSRWQPTGRGPPSRNGHRPPTAPPIAPNRADRQSTGFAVEQQPRAIGREPVRIHVDDCGQGGAKHQITANDARAALLDPNIEECPFCRPKTELSRLD